MSTLITLLQNTTLLSLGVLAFAGIRPWLGRQPRWLATCYSGALFGLLALLSMLAPVRVAPGLMLDGRVILFPLASLFTGPVAGLISALPASLYRVYLGGADPALVVFRQCYAAGVCALAGWALRDWLARRDRAVAWWHLVLLGGAIPAVMSPMVFTALGPEPAIALLVKIVPPFAAWSICGLCGLGMLIVGVDRWWFAQQTGARRDQALRQTQDAMVRIMRDELLAGRSLAERFRAITRIGAEALGIERVSIWLYDEQEGVARLAERWDDGQHDPVREVLSFDEHAGVRRAFRENLLYRADDPYGDPILSDYMNKNHADHGFQSQLFAAIQIANTTVGHVALSSIGEKKAWSLQDESFARSLADMAGFALLQDRLERKESMLEANQQLLLRIVQKVLTPPVQTDAALRSISQMIGQALEFDLTAVWLYDAQSGALRCAERWDNLAGQHIAGYEVRLPPEDTLLPAILERHVLAIDDAASYELAPPVVRELWASLSIKSILYAVIGVPGKTLGFLVASSISRRRAWSVEDQTVARSVAEILALAFLAERHGEALDALDLVPDGIYVEGRAGNVIYANPAAKALGFVDERGAASQRLPDLPPLTGDGRSLDEISWNSPGGLRRDLSVSRQRLANGGSVTMLSDITERKAGEYERQRLEEQLQQAAKMEAIGRLAGGIAHDFNNLIGAIIGFNSFLLEDLDPGSPQRKFAERIGQVCNRAKEIVQQILAFSQSSQVERSAVDLRTIVARNREILDGSLAGSTAFEVSLGDEPLPVLVNEGQLHQVLLNLCVNANDALNGAPGSITLALERIGPDHRARLLFERGKTDPGVATTFGGQLDPDRIYAAIRVTDTGVGIDAATLDRVFEPFFTRKPRGRGTGLGLAVVHGIVAAYDGAYAVSSRLGVGTEFSIFLPFHAAFPLAPESRVMDDRLAGDESVLIVDDEVDHTDALAIGLERLGYDVTRSNASLEAILAFEEDPRAWDIVVTDQMMPGISGVEMIKRIKARRPDCPTILITGFADGATERGAVRAGADGLLLKPVEPRRLAEKIRELLAARVTASA